MRQRAIWGNGDRQCWDRVTLQRPEVSLAHPDAAPPLQKSFETDPLATTAAHSEVLCHGGKQEEPGGDSRADRGGQEGADLAPEAN